MGYKKSQLNNGITVVTEKMDGVKSITLGCWFKVGSRDESEAHSGLSHFMEHMRFKGTKTRTAADISMQFDRLGAELNAFTSKEYTCFYARFVDEHLNKAIDILSDMILNSTFDDENVHSERQVVIEEIARSEDDPSDYVHELFAKAMCPTHTLGRPISGPRELVAGFERADLLAHHKEFYTSDNLIVAASGNVDHDELCALVEKAFKNMNRGKRTVREPFVESEREFRSLLCKQTEQAHVIYGMPGLPSGRDERYANAFFEIIFGGGMSSRLFQEIREKRGLVYAVYGYGMSYEGYGQYSIYAGTRPENVESVLFLIDQECKKMAREGITQEEFDRVRDYAKGQLVLGMESTRSRMTRIGKTELAGEPFLSLEELVEKYNNVALDDVNAIAARILDAKPTVAVISPLSTAVVEQTLSSVGL